MDRHRSVQRGKAERLTTAQLDRLMEEDAFRVIDEIRLDQYEDLPRPRDDLGSTKAYSNQEPARDHRMENLERMMATLATRVDQVLDRRASTPVDPPWRPYCPPDRDAFVRAHLEKERMEIPPQDGKTMAGDIFVQRLIPKPHMFIDRLEGKTLKQKMDYRDQMTFPEYVNGFLSLLCDPRASADIDFMGQIAHLRDVTEDAVTCTWPSVRQWSCLMFDLVEKGRITWSDSQPIQNYRFRTTIKGPLNAQPVDSTDAQYTKEVPCPDFNLGSCPNGGIRKHHSVGCVKFSHICSYCMVVDGFRADTHPTSTCRKKQRTAAILAAGSSHQGYNQYQQSYQHPNATSGGRNRPYSQYQQPAMLAQPPPAQQTSTLPKNA